MNVITRGKRSQWSRVVAIVSALACGYLMNATAHAEDDAQASPNAFDVPAGEQARALGITRWAVENGEIRGVNASSERIAELHIKEGSTKIESIYPDRGVRVLRGRAEDTLSERAVVFLDTFADDLNTMVAPLQAKSSDADVNEFVDCYTAVGCAQLGMSCAASGQCSSWFCSRTDPRCVEPFPFALFLDYQPGVP
ncbi:MAG: hypothetical protein ABW321_16580 [Polyangiales bacterium]